MSIHQIKKCFRHDLGRPEMLIAIIYANFADEDGKECYPTNERIAHITGYTVRTVRRIKGRLRDLGLLVKTATARPGRGTEYRLDWSNIPKKKPYKEVLKERNGDTGKGVEKEPPLEDTGNPQTIRETVRGKDKGSTASSSDASERSETESSSSSLRSDSSSPVSSRSSLSSSSAASPRAARVRPGQGEKEYVVTIEGGDGLSKAERLGRADGSDGVGAKPRTASSPRSGEGSIPRTEGRARARGDGAVEVDVEVEEAPPERTDWADAGLDEALKAVNAIPASKRGTADVAIAESAYRDLLHPEADEWAYFKRWARLRKRLLGETVDGKRVTEANVGSMLVLMAFRMGDKDDFVADDPALRAQRATDGLNYLESTITNELTKDDGRRSAAELDESLDGADAFIDAIRNEE